MTGLNPTFSPHDSAVRQGHLSDQSSLEVHLLHMNQRKVVMSERVERRDYIEKNIFLIRFSFHNFLVIPFKTTDKYMQRLLTTALFSCLRK